MIKVIVNGAQGKMGETVVTSIKEQSDLQLVAAADHQDDIAEMIQKHQANVVIDFTAPNTIFEQAQTIIANNARPVIGTTGLTLEQIDTLKKQCQEKSLGGIIAPNFSLTAVLMMRYARDAAQYFPQAEIIEMHHPQKLDAPSGTAKKTAELMNEARQTVTESQPHQAVSRGENYHGITIHSVRLPGLIAHQKVLFGGEGETLEIKQDSLSRQCFMPGVFLACRKVMELNELIYGLDNIL
jgi:4-hydroxy-tetrahydrodipicolinate reductase